MKGVIDLDAYFARIGFTGEPAPTLAVLAELMRRHICAIPFENLDVLANRPILIEPEAIQAKLVHQKRGGYCFENNGLFLEVLEQIGFDVTPLAGRIRLMGTPGEIPARTHLLHRVMIDGTACLTDVGVGGFSLSSPLRIDDEAPQATGYDTRRIVKDGRVLVHQIQSGDGWIDICEFSDDEMPFIDRFVANWCTSTHPLGMFRKFVFCALAKEDGTRIGLFGDEFTHRRGSEVLRTKKIGSLGEMKQVLAEEFGLPSSEEWLVLPSAV